ncbi:MAG TPA: stage 0 sporulation family protein [Firmicutes bacterium]|nr:stage 0 sporulation family protein [Bacillota bacterium]
MPVVVGVRFKPGGKTYYFDPADFSLMVGDQVIVETARGTEFGQVVSAPTEVPEDQVVQPLKKVLRKATENDIRQAEELRNKEQEAMAICAERIAAHGLDMNLVDVEYSFDGSKVIFYFTAEGRVDFRELVRDLASIFKTRIELRQIGVRDEAKFLGGLGPCGREICCKKFLTEFRPVSIRMAKDQNLSLNPTKISGLCGRLMCCLRFECDHYENVKSQLPDVGTRVLTPEGVGKVVAHNVLKNTVSVELADKSIVEFPPEEVETEPNGE